MMLGDFEITALLDGTHPFPTHDVMTRNMPGTGAAKPTSGKLAYVKPGEADALVLTARSK